MTTVPRPAPLPPPQQVAGFLLLLDALGLGALLALSYLLYRSWSITRNRLFVFFFLGFAVLSAGELSRLVLLAVAMTARISELRLFFLTHVAGFIPQLSQTVALTLIAIGYSLEAFRAESLQVILPYWLLRERRAAFWITGVLNTALLAYIVVNAFSVYAASRRNHSLFPALAFLSMLASNVVLLFSLGMENELLFVSSKLLHLAGLLLLLVLAVRVVRLERKEVEV
ncbi:MAG: hypothetical protein QXT33_02280 [Thermofilum sp.]